MSSKHCPRPRYRQYKLGSSFEGKILSVYSSEKGLFYAINSLCTENFCRIDQYQPEIAYKKPEEIKFGDVFIFYDKHRDSYLRAYRLNSSPVNKIAIRFFLIDIGEEVFQRFAIGQYYKLPDEFNIIQPMAVFCMLDEFPTRPDVEMKSEFLEKTLFRQLKINVKRITKLKNALGSDQLCLVVDILEVQEDDEDFQDPDAFTWNRKLDSPTIEQKFHDLSFMNGSSDEHVSFPSSFILQDSYLPEPGTKLLIYPTEVLNQKQLYCRYNKQENITNDYIPEILTVELMMNSDDTVERFESLCGEPVPGEMVIAVGRDDRYHRGQVKEIAGDLCTVGKALTSHAASITQSFTGFLRRLRLHA